jgi:hypothetical protein
MQGKIFISYRRNDGAANARSVRDRLARVFGDSNVFMDVDNLLAGKRFDKELKNAIAQTTVFLAVIGPRWLELLKERQASGERDYVHEEVAAALARELLVIPVLIEGGTLPRQNELPEDVRDLALHQKHEISHEHFGRDVEGLISAIKGEAFRPASEGVSRGFVATCLLFVCVAALAGLYFFINHVSAPTTSLQEATKKSMELDAALRRAQQEKVDAEAKLAAQSRREELRRQVEAEEQQARRDREERERERDRIRTETSVALAQPMYQPPVQQAPMQQPLTVPPTTCGWYAIAHCAQDLNAAQGYVPNFGGFVINTSDYVRFRPGWFCVVEGPMPKDAASFTMQRMKAAGATTAYIKNSC